MRGSRMTRFDRDFNEISKDATNALPIMKERKAEIQRLERKLRETRNGFIAQCTMQDLEKRRSEYRILDELI